MATLASITEKVRLTGKIAGIGIAAIIVMFFLYRGGDFIKNTFFPTPPPPPEQAFGELPRVEFPPLTPANYTYVVNTVDGLLRNFPDRMVVYKTFAPEPSLVALERARKSATGAGFNAGETKITDTVYRWSNRFGDRLEMDILSGNFKIISNFLNNAPPAQVTGNAARKEGAFEYVVGLLGSMGENTSDLNLEASKLTYLKLQNGQLVGAESQSDAQFVRLDVYQTPIDEIPIYYPNFPESTMQFILIADGSLPRIVEANFSHASSNPEEASTYGIKTTTEAFEDLKRNNAAVYSNIESGSSLDITEVKLGYYIGEEQEYFLPIFVFEGPGFTAYVNALREFQSSSATQ